jgi:hypothetical protein
MERNWKWIKRDNKKNRQSNTRKKYEFESDLEFDILISAYSEVTYIVRLRSKRMNATKECDDEAD